MLDQLYLHALIFLAGISAYSAIQHCTHEHQWPQRRVHLLFAAIALLVSLMALTNPLVFRATTVADYIVATRVNTTIGFLLLAVMPWFFAEYSGVRPMPVLTGLSGLLALLIFIGLTQPNTVFYTEIHGLKFLTLPWGERITLPQATASAWGFITLAACVLIPVFALYALAARFRRDRRRTAFVMMSAVGLLLVTVLQGVLVRLGVIHFIPFGIFSFLGMIIIMGMTLNHEMQEEREKAAEALRRSEEKFAKAFQASPVTMVLSRISDMRIIDVNESFEKITGYTREEVLASTTIEMNFWVNPAERERLLPIFLANGRLRNEELQFRAKSGKVITGLVSAELIEIDGEKFTLAVIEDITERKQAEESLRRTETRYRTLFESAQDAIFLMQGERFVDCNPLALRMFGCRLDQIIGQTPMRFSPARQPDGRDSAVKAKEKIDAALSGDPQRFEWRHCRLDGKEFEAEISLNRLELDAQPILLAIVRDITERKEAAEALHALVKATAGSGEDFFRALVMELAKVLHVKYAFVGALLPGTRERVRTVAMWAKDALALNFEYELAKAPCANVVNRSLCYYPDNVQTQFPEDKSLVEMGVVSYMGVPLFDASGSALGILAVLNDRPMESSELARSLLTILASRAATEMERQQSEEEIRRLLARVQEDAAELEKRVAERTVQLKAVNAELEAFAYSVSHDLKAPLRGIDGYSRLLLEDYAPKLDEDGRFFVHTIRKATGQMALLIDDLLAYSRLERRAMKVGSIQLHPFVDALLANYSVEVQSRRVTLKVSIPETTVQADTDGLAMALRNLIENALKFTRNTPAPAIEIGGRETERSCILWVKDNGIGFDMRYHDRIFEIFQRLQRAEEYPGTGIGLAMVRKSMERMGGRVWAESKPGEGAAFYLEVPR